MAQVSQTGTPEVRFPSAKVIINDWWLVTANQNILLRDVLSTEIVTRRYKVSWRNYFLEELAIALAMIGIPVILEIIGLHSLARGFASGLLLLIITYALSRAWNLKERSVEVALVLNTRSGPVEVPGLKSGTYVELIAKEINKRLALWSGQTSTDGTLEPIRRTLRLATPPPDRLGPIEYKWAQVTVADDEITVRGQAYPIGDVWHAEVRNEGQHRYVLLIETRNGYIRVYTTSNKLYLNMIASKVNSAVKKHARKIADTKSQETANRHKPDLDQ